MNIELDMTIGQYRELTKEEFKTLSGLISESKKNYDEKAGVQKRNRRK